MQFTKLTLIIMSLLGGSWANAVTPMELRVMQTRVFETNPETVVAAIVEMCRDHNLMPAGKFTKGGLKCLGHDVRKGSVAQWLFSSKPGASLEDSETLVRVRTTLRGDYGGLGGQVNDPKHYSWVFDQIGSYLFMNAIPWEPPTQQ